MENLQYNYDNLNQKIYRYFYRSLANTLNNFSFYLQPNFPNLLLSNPQESADHSI